MKFIKEEEFEKLGAQQGSGVRVSFPNDDRSPVYLVFSEEDLKEPFSWASLREKVCTYLKEQLVPYEKGASFLFCIRENIEN